MPARIEVLRDPIAAYRDRRFAEEAREVRSRTFLAHVRYASTGGLSVENTHPFMLDGRLFAHNGVIGDLPALESELGAPVSQVEIEKARRRVLEDKRRAIVARPGIVGHRVHARHQRGEDRCVGRREDVAQ